MEEELPVVRADVPVKMVAPVVPEEMPVAVEGMLGDVMSAVISEAEGDTVGAGGRTGKPDHGGGNEGEDENPGSHDDLPGLKGSSRETSYCRQAEPGMNG
jgi:hypothetical protein